MSATKWPFSKGHQVPDEACAGRRATQPRAVRRNAGDAVGLFLAGFHNFVLTGSVSRTVEQFFNDLPSSSLFDLLQRPGAVCHCRVLSVATSNLLLLSGKSAENRIFEGPQRFFRSLASLSVPEGDQLSSQATVQLECIVERSYFRWYACFFAATLT